MRGRNNRRATNCHRSLPMAKGQSPERSRRGAADAGSRTISIGEAYQRYPHPAFFQLLLQTKHFRKSTLGPPLGHAWGPLGHPWATKGPRTQTQTQTQSAEGRKPEKMRGAIIAAPQTVIVSKRDLTAKSNDLNPGEACTSSSQQLGAKSFLLSKTVHNTTFPLWKPISNLPFVRPCVKQKLS